jgi:predicted SprT family Zn-dependent metalloprotease
MTIRYTYKCQSCGIDYIEQRTAEQLQIVSKCNKCDAEFNLVSETPIE